MKPPTTDCAYLERSTFLPLTIGEAANAVGQSALLRFGRGLNDGNITHYLHLRQFALFHHTWSIVPDKFGGRAALVVSPSEIRCHRNPDILASSERPFSSYLTRILCRRLCQNKSDDRLQLEGLPEIGSLCPLQSALKKQGCRTEYHRLTALPLSAG